MYNTYLYPPVFRSHLACSVVEVSRLRGPDETKPDPNLLVFMSVGYGFKRPRASRVPFYSGVSLGFTTNYLILEESKSMLSKAMIHSSGNYIGISNEIVFYLITA